MIFRIAGSTALVPVTGSLVDRGAWVGASSGLTSYEGIGAQIDEIADDPAIRNVILDIDSHGGEATGMASLAARIRGLRGRKHVVAVVNDVAVSAGCGVASAADQIVVSPTSVVGSIGVVMNRQGQPSSGRPPSGRPADPPQSRARTPSRGWSAQSSSRSMKKRASDTKAYIKSECQDA